MLERLFEGLEGVLDRRGVLKVFRMIFMLFRRDSGEILRFVRDFMRPKERRLGFLCFEGYFDGEVGVEREAISFR